MTSGWHARNVERGVECAYSMHSVRQNDSQSLKAFDPDSGRENRILSLAVNLELISLGGGRRQTCRSLYVCSEGILKAPLKLSLAV